MLVVDGVVLFRGVTINSRRDTVLWVMSVTRWRGHLSENEAGKCGATPFSLHARARAQPHRLRFAPRQQRDQQEYE